MLRKGKLRERGNVEKDRTEEQWEEGSKEWKAKGNGESKGTGQTKRCRVRENLKDEGTLGTRRPTVSTAADLEQERHSAGEDWNSRESQDEATLTTSRSLFSSRSE